jgi:hypothetical protein
MRGRLYEPFLAELYQLDVPATAADPDATGKLHSGMDPDFKQVTSYTDATTKKRTSAIRYGAAQLVPCQIEINTFDTLQVMPTGAEAQARVVLVFHYRTLEAMGLIDMATGDCAIKISDKVTSIKNTQGETVHVFRLGLYVTAVVPSFGIGTRPDLLLVTFEDRAQGAH